eukprot:TRINITY_DN25145_c0_g1_i1.p1 TRINITY_DN25145_c0_g1~~TRINITY_DN25145_c0_g1_i1.p1  ORF type:complete len:460 (+),score=149.47 TRINITY_DN25145_c0_g1_i1:52-1431(+)
MYTPMDTRAMKELLATREALLGRLGAVAARRAAGAECCGVPKVPRRPPAAAVEAAKGRLAVPMMSAEEALSVTVNMKDVQADGGVGLKGVLAAHGMAIVEDVVCAEENEVMEKLWQSDLVALAADVKYNRDPQFHHAKVKQQYERLVRDGPQAWPSATLCRDKFSHKRGLMHGGYAWAARLHPCVREVYSCLLEEPPQDLCVGMDHVFFTSEKKQALRDDRNWMHCDFNEHIEGGEKPCFQSILYTWDATRDTAATTVIWPGSHTDVFRSLQDDAAESGARSHFVLHSKVRDKTLRKALADGSNARARRVPVPAGALLVWDSRTSHQGWAGGERLAMPVCWESKAWRSEGARRRKLWLAATGLPSNHWATLGKVHTSQTALMDTTSAATPPHEQVGLADELLFPCYGSIVPYGVDPARMSHWHKAVPRLWTGTAERSCAQFNQPEVVEKFLRPEILAAL